MMVITILYIAALLAINIELVSCAYSKDSRSIRIKNDSSRKVELFWINVETNELVPQFRRPLLPTFSDNINSFVGHSFLVKQEPYINCDPGRPAEDEGLTYEGQFTVGNGDNQVFIIEDGLKITHSDTETTAAEESKEYIQKCLSLSENNGEHDYEKFTSCLENKVVDKLWKENYDEFTYQSDLNDRMSRDLNGYACRNRQVIKKDTEQANYFHWSYGEDEYDVDVQFENEHTKILVIDDFISEEECEIIQEKASNFIESDTATMELKDLNRDLSLRMHAFARDVTGFEYRKNQDDPILFHKTPSNQYFTSKPHCDGECKGKRYDPNSNENVASIVIFCDVPDDDDNGYSVNFDKARVHIDAMPGMAIFYSYVGEDFSTDYGFTEYTECPLKEGEIIGIKHSFRPFLND